VVNFFIASLPRSGTAWLANYLTYGDMLCLHDGFRELKTPIDMKAVLADTGFQYTGNCDASNLYFQSAIRDLFPKAKYIYIDRDPLTCEKSWKNKGGNDMKDWAIRAHEWITKSNDVMIVQYDDLFERSDEIGRYINPKWKCPPLRREMLRVTNIQQDFDRVGYNLDIRPLLEHVEPVEYNISCHM
jgi:hypothetical protein